MRFKLENLFDFRQLIKHLSSGLSRLTLLDNFEGRKISFIVPAGEELAVRNPLNFTPSSYIIINKYTNGTIYRSNRWTNDFVYFTNDGLEDVSVDVFLSR